MRSLDAWGLLALYLAALWGLCRWVAAGRRS